MGPVIIIKEPAPGASAGFCIRAALGKVAALGSISVIGVYKILLVKCLVACYLLDELL